MPTRLRSRCIISSVPSTLPAAAQAAANVRVFARQGIHLELLNMKFMKDINSFFGQYQAGADSETPAPQVSYKQNDPEANSAVEGREQQCIR